MHSLSGRPFTIRACRPEDLEEILSIERISFPDPFDLETFTEILKAEPEGFLVAESGLRVVGYVAGVSSRDDGFVYSIAVEPGSRREGLGRLLMQAELAYLSPRVRRVYLQVSVNNRAAIALYEGFSFVIVKRLRGYYPNGDDAFLMVLEPTRRWNSGEGRTRA